MLRCRPDLGGSHIGFAGVNISTPDAKMLEVSKYSVEIRNPQNKDDHYDAIQDRFNLSLHWDEPVYKPQQKPCGNKCDQDSGKWHFIFSNHFRGLGPRPEHDPEAVSVLSRRVRSGHARLT